MLNRDPDRVDESPRLRYRTAEAHDAQQIADLWKGLSVDQLAKDRFYGDDPEVAIAADAEQFTRNLADPECAIYVAENEGSLVAFIEVWLRDRDSTFFIDDYAYILHFFVDPEWRSSDIYDICNSLYTRAEAWALEHGRSTIQADVFYHNEKMARILTQRVGFEVYRTRFIRPLGKGES